MAFNKPPPPRWCRPRGRHPIYWPQIHFHHLFSTVCCAPAVFHAQPASGKSNLLIKRSWDEIQHTIVTEAEDLKPRLTGDGLARPQALPGTSFGRALYAPHPTPP